MSVTKIIKKITLVAAINLVAVSVLFSQSYYHSPNDTIISSANFDDVSVYNITQVHTLNDTILFKYHKHNVVMPASWEAYLCDNTTCHPDLKDSSAMVAVAGDNGLMSLHLNPHFETGTGIIRYLIFDTNTPSQVDTLTWIISAGATGIKTINAENPIITLKNQILSITNAGEGFDKLNILDVDGRILYHTSINRNEVYTIPNLQTPIIIVRLTGSKNSYIQKINFLFK